MILDDIVAHKKTEARRNLAEVKTEAAAAPPARDFAAALLRPGLSVIAEVKRRSPGAGIINQRVDPAAQAELYAQAGASAVSVLTDERFFGGSAADLQAIRRRVALPLLRKDFTLAEYHVYEARAIGADAVLLIVRALDQSQLSEFQQLARELGMAALIEVHDEAELERAVVAQAAIIGINNRDLQTMTVDVSATVRLRPLVPHGATVISESGIRTAGDVRTIMSAGVDAILVGEALMAAGDPSVTLRGFIDAAQVAA